MCLSVCLSVAGLKEESAERSSALSHWGLGLLSSDLESLGPFKTSYALLRDIGIGLGHRPWLSVVSMIELIPVNSFDAVS